MVKPVEEKPVVVAKPALKKSPSAAKVEVEKPSVQEVKKPVLKKSTSATGVVKPDEKSNTESSSKLIACKMEKILVQLGRILEELTKIPDHKILVSFPSQLSAYFWGQFFRSFLFRDLIWENTKTNLGKFAEGTNTILFHGAMYKDSVSSLRDVGITHVIQFCIPKNEDLYFERLKLSQPKGQHILLISDWEEKNVLSGVFKNVVKPPHAPAYPEDKKFEELHQKIVTAYATFPLSHETSKFVRLAWTGMFDVVFEARDDKAEIFNNLVKPLFLTCVNKKYKLSLYPNFAKRLGIADVKIPDLVVLPDYEYLEQFIEY